MSIEIAWDTITEGAEGEELAERIRDFIHDKFQQVPLPRFIKSVHVHSFAFGSTCPQVEIKDISDPLPDFYEDGESDDGEEREENESEEPALPPNHPGHDRGQGSRPTAIGSHGDGLGLPYAPAASAAHSQSAQDFNGRTLLGYSHRIGDLHDTQLPRSGSPGIPGGTSNFSYFHLPMGGLSGTQTPLAAVASGGPLSPVGWHHDFPHSSLAPFSGPCHPITESSTGVLAQLDHRAPPTRPSTANTIPTPPDLGSPENPSSPERLPHAYPRAEKVSDDPTNELQDSVDNFKLPSIQPSDMQVVARVQYSGDIRMTLTAEILLDYPMPSFVGIPLKLSITGMVFDGVAILAYIRKRMHFCFLDPDDAQTLVGDHVTQADQSFSRGEEPPTGSLSGLLKEIHIESEIGRKEDGKQVLKNVGKVEKFVLEQIRRIFEDEFVFPSFWTFLV